MAAITTIRISQEAHRILKMAAEQKKISLVEALDEITRTWEREHFFNEMNNAYAALKEDAEAWETEKTERAVWDAALTDNQEAEDGVPT